MIGDKFQAINTVSGQNYQFEQTAGDTELGTGVFKNTPWLQKNWTYGIPQETVAANYTYNDHFLGQVETNIRRIWGT